jgi:hypothetical protein
MKLSDAEIKIITDNIQSFLAQAPLTIILYLLSALLYELVHRDIIERGQE